MSELEDDPYGAPYDLPAAPVVGPDRATDAERAAQFEEFWFGVECAVTDTPTNDPDRFRRRIMYALKRLHYRSELSAEYEDKFGEEPTEA